MCATLKKINTNVANAKLINWVSGGQTMSRKTYFSMNTSIMKKMPICQWDVPSLAHSSAWLILFMEPFLSKIAVINLSIIALGVLFAVRHENKLALLHKWITQMFIRNTTRNPIRYNLNGKLMAYYWPFFPLLSKTLKILPSWISISAGF